MTTTTRRSVVTGALAAALPVAAVAAPTAVDPTFALIESHKVARERSHNALRVANQLEDSLPKARVLVGKVEDIENGVKVALGDHGREIYAHTHEQIDDFFKRYLGMTLPGIQYHRKTETEYFEKLGPLKYSDDGFKAARIQLDTDNLIAQTAAHAELDRDRDRQEAAKDAAGLPAADDACEIAGSAACDAFFDLINNEPTTIAGHVAKLSYFLELEADGTECFLEEYGVLPRLRYSLAKLAGTV